MLEQSGSPCDWPPQAPKSNPDGSEKHRPPRNRLRTRVAPHNASSDTRGISLARVWR